MNPLRPSFEVFSWAAASITLITDECEGALIELMKVHPIAYRTGIMGKMKLDRIPDSGEQGFHQGLCVLASYCCVN